jgi:hypothetical protein
MVAQVEVVLAELRRGHCSWGPKRLVFELAKRGVEPLHETEQTHDGTNHRNVLASHPPSGHSACHGWRRTPSHDAARIQQWSAHQAPMNRLIRRRTVGNTVSPSTKTTMIMNPIHRGCGVRSAAASFGSTSIPLVRPTGHRTPLPRSDLPIGTCRLRSLTAVCDSASPASV